MPVAAPETPRDTAARIVVTNLVKNSKLTYQEIDRITRGEIKQSRVRDICTGMRGGIRVSELMTLAKISGGDVHQLIDEIQSVAALVETVLQEDHEPWRSYAYRLADMAKQTTPQNVRKTPLRSSVRADGVEDDARFKIRTPSEDNDMLIRIADGVYVTFDTYAQSVIDEGEYTREGARYKAIAISQPIP